MFSSFADKDTRPVEIVVFAVIMTLLCGLLFKELLSLPIPFDPPASFPEPSITPTPAPNPRSGRCLAASKTCSFAEGRRRERSFTDLRSATCRWG